MIERNYNYENLYVKYHKSLNLLQNLCKYVFIVYSKISLFILS